MAETGSAAHSRPAPGRDRPHLRRALLLAGFCAGVTGGLLALSQAAQAGGSESDGSSLLGRPAVLPAVSDAVHRTRSVVEAVHRTPAAEPVAALAPSLGRILTGERPVSRPPANRPVPGIVRATRPVQVVLSAVRSVRGVLPTPSSPKLGTVPPILRPVPVGPTPEIAVPVAGPAHARDSAATHAHPGSVSAAPPAASGWAVLVLHRAPGAVAAPTDMTPPPMAPAPLDPSPCPPQTAGSASASGTGHTDLAGPPVAGPDPPVTIRTALRRQGARLCGATILPDSRPG